MPSGSIRIVAFHQLRRAHRGDTGIDVLPFSIRGQHHVRRHREILADRKRGERGTIVEHVRHEDGLTCIPHLDIDTG